MTEKNMRPVSEGDSIYYDYDYIYFVWLVIAFKLLYSEIWICDTGI